MSNYLIQSETLSGIANAIRGKTGGSTEIPVEDFATEISGIQTGHKTTIDGVEVEKDLDLMTNNVSVSDVYSINDLYNNASQTSKWVMLDKSHPIIPNVFKNGTDIKLNIKRYCCGSGWTNIIQDFVLFSNIDPEKTGIFKSNLYRVDDRILYLVGYDAGGDVFCKIVDITDTSNPTVIYTGSESDDSIVYDIVERNNGGLIIENGGTGKIKTLEMNYTNNTWVIGSPITSDLNIIAENAQSFAVGLLNDDSNGCVFIACANSGNASLHKRAITIYRYDNQGLSLLDTDDVNYYYSGSYARGVEPVYAGKDADNNHYFVGSSYCRIKVTFDSSEYMITSLTQLNNSTYGYNSAQYLFGDTKLGYDNNGGYYSSNYRKFYNLPEIRNSSPASPRTLTWNIPYYTEV